MRCVSGLARFSGCHLEPGIFSELWELTQAFLEAKRRGIFYQNTAFCFNYQRPCPYFALCRSNGNPNVIENFYQSVPPNEELRVVPIESTEPAF